MTQSPKDKAERARERHERLYAQSIRDAGRPGITKLRYRVGEAFKERMRAELEAGQ